MKDFFKELITAYPNIILDFWQQEHDVADKIHDSFVKMNYKLQIQENNVNEVRRISTRVYTEEFTNKYQFFYF